MKTPIMTAFFVLDHLGAPVMLVEGDGTVAWKQNRDAFGRSVVDPTSRLTCPLRASSQYADEESGLNYSFHRYYDPGLGRYINRDPIGEVGGINLYGFCGNNPVNSFDPLGLAPNQAGVTDPNHVLQALTKDPSLANIRDAHGGNQDRYFYTDKYGWVDIRHFAEAGRLSENGCGLFTEAVVSLNQI
jgi:RHS repeat-associated protein